MTARLATGNYEVERQIVDVVLCRQIRLYCLTDPALLPNRSANKNYLLTYIGRAAGGGPLLPPPVGRN